MTMSSNLLYRFKPIVRISNPELQRKHGRYMEGIAPQNFYIEAT